MESKQEAKDNLNDPGNQTWLQEQRTKAVHALKVVINSQQDPLQFYKWFIVSLQFISLGIALFAATVLLINGVVLAVRSDDRYVSAFLWLLISVAVAMYVCKVVIAGVREENYNKLLVHAVVLCFVLGYFTMPIFEKVRRLHQFAFDFRIYYVLHLVRLVLGYAELGCVVKLLMHLTSQQLEE